MIERILPAGVRGADTRVDAPESVLFAEEREQIARAVATRRAEYATVRDCARTALSYLGVEPVPLPKGEKGSPRWPRGIVGSMTHTDGYRAAAVAFALQVRSVGIDAERNGPLPGGVLASVSLPAERDAIARRSGTAAAGGDGVVHWDRLLFSAKETTYKAWYPLTRRWLGFEDAEITFTVDGPDHARGGGMTEDGAVEDGADEAGGVASGGFSSRILVPGDTVGGGPLTVLHGRWLASERLVITTMAVV